MNIAVDAGCLGVKDKRLKVGVYNVVYNLLLNLSKIDTTNTYYLYSFYPIEKSIVDKLGPRMKNIVIPAKGWLRLWLPLRIMIDKIDIFLGLNQAQPYKYPLISNYKTIGIFYDIAFEKYPSLYSYTGSLNKLKMHSRILAKQADTIITISQATQQDLIDIYKVPKERIYFGYPSIKNVFYRTYPSHSTQKPYFLFVGSYKKSKNIPNLIRAYSLFIHQSSLDVNLILVGGDKWLDPDIEIELQTLSEAVKKHIIFKNDVSDERIASLYSRALAFVSPSFYEGFGLTFVEAMASGCPVIGSGKGSLPEIIGKAGVMVSPHDVEGIKNAMMLFANSSKKRLSYRKKGKIRAQELQKNSLEQKTFESIQRYEY